MTELETAAAEYAIKEKKFEEDAAKEKDRFKRLQSLAKKYREQGKFNFLTRLSIVDFFPESLLEGLSGFLIIITVVITDGILTSKPLFKIPLFAI